MGYAVVASVRHVALIVLVAIGSVAAVIGRIKVSMDLHGGRKQRRRER